MFLIIRCQEKDTVFCIIDLHEKSCILRRPHQMDIGKLMIQSAPCGPQNMGGMKPCPECGADRKIRVRLILLRLMDIRRPSLFLSEFFHPFQPEGIKIAHRKVRHKPQLLADGKTRVHCDHIGIFPIFHEFRSKFPVRRSARHDQAGIRHFSSVCIHIICLSPIHGTSSRRVRPLILRNTPQRSSETPSYSLPHRS